MKSFVFTVTDPVGIHAHPAGRIVKKTKEFPDSIFMLERQGKTINMGKLMALMGMGIKGGDEITVRVEGGDEEAAAAAMEAFLQENL